MDEIKKRKKLSHAEQRAAHTKRDEDFFAERKVQDAANLAKTERLKALRLAHEAAHPAEPAQKSGSKPFKATRKRAER